MDPNCKEDYNPWSEQDENLEEKHNSSEKI